MRVNGRRYKARFEVVLKASPIDLHVIVHEDAEIVVDGKSMDRYHLLLWADQSGDAECVVTRDPKRHGYCTRLEFTSKEKP